MTLKDPRYTTRREFLDDLDDAMAYMMAMPFRIPISFTSTYPATAPEWNECVKGDVIDIPVKIVEPQKLLKP